MKFVAIVASPFFYLISGDTYVNNGKNVILVAIGGNGLKVMLGLAGHWCVGEFQQRALRLTFI